MEQFKVRPWKGGKECKELENEARSVKTAKCKACFVLPLREVAAHLACQNARSMEAEMAGWL
jgi:hypothetical protein